MTQPAPSRPSWTFMSNHGHVLVCLAADPDLTMREVAERVGITERAVQGIVADLTEDGYLRKEKVGRRNHYRLVAERHFRHPLEREVTIGDFLALLRPGSPPDPQTSTSATRS